MDRMQTENAMLETWSSLFQKIDWILKAGIKTISDPHEGFLLHSFYFQEKHSGMRFSFIYNKKVLTLGIRNFNGKLIYVCAPEVSIKEFASIVKQKDLFAEVTWSNGTEAKLYESSYGEVLHLPDSSVPFLNEAFLPYKKNLCTAIDAALEKAHRKKTLAKEAEVREEERKRGKSLSSLLG